MWDPLIDEYRESLRLVRKARRAAKLRLRLGQDEERAELDCELLASMERDLLWTIEYLETGVMPDNHRGVYRWVVPVDPARLRYMVRGQTKAGESSGWVTSDEQLEELLSTLTERERDALVMVRGRGISYRQAAEYLGVSPSTVSAMVRRAERKVRRTAYLLASNEVCRAPHTIRVEG